MELSSPICGTISHGKYNQADEKNTTMITGRPLLEAIEFEKKQNWVGVMIAPSVIKAHRTLLEITNWVIHDPRELDKILKYAKYMCFIHSCNKIPFNNSPSYESLVIVPINSKHEQIRSISSSFSEYINELKYLRATAPSPYTQQKYDDSLDFLYDVSGDWMVTLRMEGFSPIHDISMWV
ncbi:unnamed protein product [marine sediment metagenome]|uniref:Uncharacterized protein n=1 Tax=marine sediment metagenome TaxID=412755 RepID=X0TAN5_9ZZZZ